MTHRLIIVVLLAISLACSHPNQRHLRKEYREATSLALDALQRASQFRDSAAELFQPPATDLENDNRALQAVTNHNDAIENGISSQFAACEKDLKSHRETFARNDLQLSEQSAAIVDTCVSTARALFQAAE
ncbi:MAG TPA: hypothetical protein VHZ74_07425 [Bryobacteraceae bacterium]|nr:hypothetical protein [Bryobacteraceae bacterium]